MSEEVKAGKEKSEVIDLREKQVVYATDKAPYHSAGEEVSCHPKIAETMLKNGWATDKPNGKK